MLRERIAGTHPRRHVRHHAAHCLPRTVPGRQGGVACHAPAGSGSFLISNNSSSLRGRKRMTGQSLYYPRVMMRTLAQVLTEEYSEHGVHVANVVIDGTIDSGTRRLPRPAAPGGGDESREDRRGVLLPPRDKSCWTHELQLTPLRRSRAFKGVTSARCLPRLACLAQESLGTLTLPKPCRSGRERGGRTRASH